MTYGMQLFLELMPMLSLLETTFASVRLTRFDLDIRLVCAVYADRWGRTEAFF